MMPRRVMIEGVGKRFGARWAVEEVDFALAPGECVGLLGHNGAGKTTLIKMMLGLLRPDRGRLSVFGGDPAGEAGREIRRRIGYLPENVSLYPSLSGTETLTFFARLKGVPAAAALPLLARVGLSAEAAARPVGTYSKGMRQRLALAQALLGGPELLLLDEPTTGLDPSLRLEFYRLLRALRGEGVSVVISSHQLAELEGEVDRVVVLNAGRKVADGDLASLRARLDARPELRIRLDGRGPAPAGWEPLAPGLYARRVSEAELGAVLAALPPGAEGIEIRRPSLDDLYAALLERALIERHGEGR